MPDDYSPSKFWVLSVLQRVQKPGSAWPNTLLVVGYRHLPSAAKESDPDLQATGVEDYEVPTDSPDWYPIFDKLRRHLVAIAHVNTSIPEFVAITVGRFVRFVKVNARESGVGLRLIPMESDPVYDIAHQNHAVQQILSHMNEGREVIQTLVSSILKNSVVSCSAYLFLADSVLYSPMRIHSLAKDRLAFMGFGLHLGSFFPGVFLLICGLVI